MRVLVTGGTGAVGRFIVEALLDAGHVVTLLGRRPPPAGLLPAPTGFTPWSLGEAVALPAADALVHAAFDHLPGAFRGGEGDDPARFWHLNHDGSVALFEAAARAGIRRTVFLSSRAVYGDHRRGQILWESDAPQPDSFYGELKLATERALLGRADGGGAAVRATGVYGNTARAPAHKWAPLIEDFLAGRPVAPRCATELHGADLADAVRRLLEAHGPQLGPGIFNASDILLDRHDLLARVRAITGCANPLPDRAPPPPPGAMACSRLMALGWQPGGFARLERFLGTLFPPAGAAVAPPPDTGRPTGPASMATPAASDRRAGSRPLV
jgi:nucleoside-diphosphate-sugar epimerase